MSEINNGQGTNEEKLDPSIAKEVERQYEILTYGVVDITPEDEFKAMLKESIVSGKPLRVKCGIDPTSSDVHLGHLVPYKKMRQFQDLGHIGMVVIGDYTARIGDPTGLNEERPPLSQVEIEANATEYMKQLYTVLDEDKTEVFYQSEWFEDVTLSDVIKWASQTTVAKLIAHDTFRNRLDIGHALSLHEMFYPILQGIDSVYMRADVELGGTDQRFNVLMGRDYLRAAGMRPQVAMLLPLVSGTCGTQKMSKSLGNYIGILSDPFDKFGKIMSIPDDLMLEYYKYVAGVTHAEYEKIKDGLARSEFHPNETKKDLAQRIVSFFHGEEEGKAMRKKFEGVFAKGKVPDDAPEIEFIRGVDILTLLLENGLIPSKGEGRRLLKSNAIGVVDGAKITDHEYKLDESLAGKVIKIGKRKFLKLK